MSLHMNSVQCILASTLYYLSQRWPKFCRAMCQSNYGCWISFHCNVGPINVSAVINCRMLLCCPNSSLSVNTFCSWYSLSGRWRYACAIDFRRFSSLVRKCIYCDTTPLHDGPFCLFRHIARWLLVEYVFANPNYWLRHKSNDTLVTIRNGQ